LTTATTAAVVSSLEVPCSQSTFVLRFSADGGKVDAAALSGFPRGCELKAGAVFNRANRPEAR